jgi:hypothetical protein
MAATRQTITWVKNSQGTPALYVSLPEAPSQTFKKGAAVTYDISDNQIAEVARSSGQMSADQFFGIAAEDASGVTGQDLDILIPGVDDIFMASLASGEDTVVAPTYDNTVGKLMGIIKLSTTGGAGTEYVLDTGATTHVKGVIIYPPDSEKRGGKGSTMTAGDRVLFKFLSSEVLEEDGQVS